MLMRLVIASSVYRIVVDETNSALVSPLMQNARVQVPPDARRGYHAFSYISLSIFATCEPSARLTTVIAARCRRTRSAIIFLFVYTKGRLGHTCRFY